MTGERAIFYIPAEKYKVLEKETGVIAGYVDFKKVDEKTVKSILDNARIKFKAKITPDDMKQALGVDKGKVILRKIVIELLRKEEIIGLGGIADYKNTLVELYLGGRKIASDIDLKSSERDYYKNEIEIEQENNLLEESVELVIETRCASVGKRITTWYRITLIIDVYPIYKLTVRLVDTLGKPVYGLVVVKDATGRIVNRGEGTEIAFMLPKGNYILSVSVSDRAYHKDHRVKLTRSILFTIDDIPPKAEEQYYVTVTVYGKINDVRIPLKGITVRVLTEREKEVDRKVTDENGMVTFTLYSGKYIFEARDDQNMTFKTKRVTESITENKEITIVLERAEFRLLPVKIYIYDEHGRLVPNVKVKIKSSKTGEVLTLTTNNEGVINVNLEPGEYIVKPVEVLKGEHTIEVDIFKTEFHLYFEKIPVEIPPVVYASVAGAIALGVIYVLYRYKKLKKEMILKLARAGWTRIGKVKGKLMKKIKR